ncbi:hypothetical protein EVAR_46458_1 [Eumeta japonica]|uniref:Uncharacterized protein n=1 Tax=Eumeta variegata TaxID=151549 RepID=A0A4C1XJY5_EUMVA|nr:hypothetical protein EVAR_46458_1 [Eumeta japonica]
MPNFKILGRLEVPFRGSVLVNRVRINSHHGVAIGGPLLSRALSPRRSRTPHRLRPPPSDTMVNNKTLRLITIEMEKFYEPITGDDNAISEFDRRNLEVPSAGRRRRTPAAVDLIL